MQYNMEFADVCRAAAYTGMTLPIMNWSSGTMIELASVGLMLGAYRRKDMLGYNRLSFTAY
ncbi:hypothetical protein ACFPYJ_11425 [Paenibacillus solisilvae]|uniref:Uncharacterized protein n=1 Tax=Paenibacillus solisilvae TaxID=2486751 RepID=A0ABW0VZX6_9BACL